MKISILTLFPEMFVGPFDHSIVKRAQEKGAIEIELINIRDFGVGSHKMVDDTPYGGGVGMVLKVDVVHQAIEYAKQRHSGKREPSASRILSNTDSGQARMTRVVLMSATGTPFEQPTAKAYASLDHLILICGHYEGIDARIGAYIDEEVSIGDFVLTGGEIPTMLITDAVTRLIPGVLPQGATDNESFSLSGEKETETYLEYPHYTKPAAYNGMEVPEVLRGGNHKEIAAWKKEQSRLITKTVRPDLLKKAE
ncbi:MAG: tRNA (guanosine(37)-N1)-methyltransferase TrmD [Patescibacteria group bacterium]